MRGFYSSINKTAISKKIGSAKLADSQRAFNRNELEYFSTVENICMYIHASSFIEGKPNSNKR